MAFSKRRRDQEFHKMFNFVPEDEILLRDYSCAWNKDILHHGRLYLSQNWFCFKDTVLGSDISIKVEDVRSVAKQKTAYVIPNALEIVTVTSKKFFFTTFRNRNRVFYDIVRIWTNNVNGKLDTQTDLLVELSQKPKENPVYQEMSSSPKKTSGSGSGGSGGGYSDTDVVTLDRILQDKSPLEPHYLIGTDDSPTKKDTFRISHSCSEDGMETVGDIGIDGSVPLQTLQPTTPTLLVSGSSGETTSSAATSDFVSSSDGDADMTGEPPSKKQPVSQQQHPHNGLIRWHTFSGDTKTLKFNKVLRFCARPVFLFNFLMIILAMVLVLTTVTLVCHLSQVSPFFNSILSWQPWCTYICPRGIQFHDLGTLIQQSNTS